MRICKLGGIKLTFARKTDLDIMATAKFISKLK